MHHEFAFVCDYADDCGGKITAIGLGFDRIYAQHLPYIHPLFFFVAKVRATPAEVGEKEANILVLNEDGKKLFDARGPLSVAMFEKGTAPSFQIVFRFEGFCFPDYGDYSLHLVLSGNEICSVPIRVVSPPSTA